MDWEMTDEEMEMLIEQERLQQERIMNDEEPETGLTDEDLWELQDWEETHTSFRDY